VARKRTSDQRTTSYKSKEVKLIAMRKRNVIREVTSSKLKWSDSQVVRIIKAIQDDEQRRIKVVGLTGGEDNKSDQGR